MKKIVMLTAFLMALSTILFAQDTVQEIQTIAVKQHPVVLALIGSTTASVPGIFVFVAKYLLPEKR